ncbi:hypothetical protein QR66_08465 [Chromobacterium piscinae]|nr:hypothetical protein QR66_08465 [Chromobacterium piscinae]
MVQTENLYTFSLLSQHVFNQTDNHLFLCWIRFCHQKRQSGKANIIDYRLTILNQHSISV